MQSHLVGRDFPGWLWSAKMRISKLWEEEKKVKECFEIWTWLDVIVGTSQCKLKKGQASSSITQETKRCIKVSHEHFDAQSRNYFNQKLEWLSPRPPTLDWTCANQMFWKNDSANYLTRRIDLDCVFRKGGCHTIKDEFNRVMSQRYWLEQILNTILTFFMKVYYSNFR